MVIVPVGTVQVGCDVTLAVRAVTVNEMAGDVQPLLELRTVTGYVPAATPVKIPVVLV